MNRKFVLAVSLASLLAVPAVSVYADDEEKKPEQPQLIAEGDDNTKTDLIMLSEGMERQDLADLIILSEGDDQKPEQPQLV